MNIPDWITEALKNIPKAEPRKFIMDLLELGEITPHNGKYSKLVELTVAYEEEMKITDLDVYFKHYTPSDVIRRIQYFLQISRPAPERLQLVRDVLNKIDLSADVFKVLNLEQLGTADTADLNAERDAIINAVLRTGESVSETDQT